MIKDRTSALVFLRIQHATRHAVEDMILQLCAYPARDVHVVIPGVKVVIAVKAAIVVTLALVVTADVMAVIHARVVLPAKDAIAATMVYPVLEILVHVANTVVLVDVMAHSKKRKTPAVKSRGSLSFICQN